MPMPAKQLRQTVRRLARAPLFTVVAALTLAIGIGANTAVFSVIYGVLLKPLPYPEPERLVGVWHTAKGLGLDSLNQGPSLYFLYREENRAFEESGMWNADRVAVTGIEQPEQVRVVRVTDGVLPLLHVTPERGRLFSREDGAHGSPATVILAHGYWQTRFGGDPQIVGKSLTIDGEPREVIGVMRPGFKFLDREASLFLPYQFNPAEISFGQFSYRGIARLKPEATMASANAEVARLLPVAVERFPMPPGFTKAMVDDAKLGPNVRPLMVDVIGNVGQTLWVIFATVGLVLLVACANVANLFLVRSESRQHELAVRSALGASRGQVARELLSESLVLGVLGGIAGLGLAWLGLQLLVGLAPQGLPRLAEIAIDPLVLAFTLVISLVTAVLFGAVAAIKLGSSTLAHSLKDEGRGASAGAGRLRARNALVVSQIALALVLLVGSGLLLRSFQALNRVHPGFERPKEVLTFRLSIPSAEVEDSMAVVAAYQTIGERIQAIPGVSSVGFSSSITMDGYDSNDPIFVEDHPVAADVIPPLRRMKWITPGYFETMGNPLLAGRAITWADLYDRAPVAVVTESLARVYWPEIGQALGKRIRANPGGLWREIVGVVADVRDNGLDQDPTPIVYWPMAMDQWWEMDRFVERSLGVAVRSSRATSPSLLAEAQQAVWSVSSNLPLANVRTLEEILETSMARTSFTVVMLAIAALTALLLGAVGTYGVTSYVAAQRRREIGVRMALGAARQDVARLVLRHGLSLAAAGVVVGLAAAAGFTRLLARLLFGVSPLDPMTYLAVAAGVVMVATAASYAPARRAAATDPVETLRG